mgnify:CR=1 FL=1
MWRRVTIPGAGGCRAALSWLPRGPEATLGFPPQPAASGRNPTSLARAAPLWNIGLLLAATAAAALGLAVLDRPLPQPDGLAVLGHQVAIDGENGMTRPFLVADLAPLRAVRAGDRRRAAPSTGREEQRSTDH